MTPPELWTCPRCGRVFRQVHQRHSCGVGSRTELFDGKPPALATLYRSLEKTVRSWSGVEIVNRDRYVLIRTTRIFADLVFMRDALRLMVILDRTVRKPMFFKVASMSPHRVGHVTKIRTAAELRAALPFLKEAYAYARGEHPAAGRRAKKPSPVK